VLDVDRRRVNKVRMSKPESVLAPETERAQ